MSSVGNGKGAAAPGISSIPVASKKVVQSLKEIVNCPEAEIYAMLRECNMDPNETVNRLLTQDPFHEVKSKREKKKENKDTTEYRPRGGGNPSNRGGRVGTDRRTGPTHYNYAEAGNPHERHANRKGNGTYSHAAPYSYSSTSHVANNDVNQNVSSFSDDAPKDSKVISASRGDGFSSSVQPASGLQSAWGGGNVGQLSMADIVKKGISQNKAPGPVNSAQYGNYNHVVAARAPLLPHHAMHQPHDHVLSGPGSDIGSNQHKDDWPAIEHPQASTFSSVHSAENHEMDDLHYSRSSQNVNSDDNLLQHDKPTEPVNATNLSVLKESVGDTLYCDNSPHEDSSLYQQYGHPYQHEEAEDNHTSLSNIAATMQQLSLEKDEHAQLPKVEEIRSVVIPDHLQVQSSECLNLSFGSFGAGIPTGLSGTSTAGSLKNDVEEQSEAEDASPVVHSDYRNTEYYEDEQVRSSSPEGLINRNGMTDDTQTSASPSPPEVTTKDIHSEAEGTQYAYTNSLPGYNFDNSHQHQLNAVYAQLQTSSQMQNTTPFPNVMAYSNLSPASLLASTVQQPVRDSDVSYSQFHANQLMAAKYGTSGSVGGPSAPGAEALETSNMSSSQQALPSANANATAPGPGLPQNLPMHPYSQPSLPLGPFANMISYPFLPPSYTYMPSAFQQAFNRNSSYHQSLASVLPQYKNNISVSSLPQTGAIPSGYGAFGGNSTNAPVNFSLNQNANPGGSSIGYDELASAQYKEHLLALQQLQNENSAMYAHGNGTRTMSAVPANAYYNNFQGQSQQPTGFRQNQQQPSQHYGTPSYPNFYHSQSGMSMEHQQQNPRDESIGGSQVQPSKQSQQQMWQNSY